LVLFQGTLLSKRCKGGKMHDPPIFLEVISWPLLGAIEMCAKAHPK